MEIIEMIYGFGKSGRYRVMSDYQLAKYFIGLGWIPKFTLQQREAEINKRVADGLSRTEAAWEIDEEIQEDLENWIQLNFTVENVM